MASEMREEIHRVLDERAATIEAQVAAARELAEQVRAVRETAPKEAAARALEGKVAARLALNEELAAARVAAEAQREADQAERVRARPRAPARCACAAGLTPARCVLCSPPLARLDTGGPDPADPRARAGAKGPREGV